MTKTEEWRLYSVKWWQWITQQKECGQRKWSWCTWRSDPSTNLHSLKKTVGIVPAEIQIDHFPDTSQKHQSLRKPAQYPNGEGNKVLMWKQTNKTKKRKGLSTVFLGTVCENQARCVHTNTITQIEAATSRTLNMTKSCASLDMPLNHCQSADI